MAISKRILSVIMAVALILTIVPMGVSAVEINSGETYSANNAMVDDGTGREVIPMATVTATEVVRVAAASGSMAKGTTIVSATPSGVPQIGGSFTAEAYAGETPSAAQITFTSDFSLAKNKNVTIACTNNASVIFAVTNPNNNTWIWTITGGTASAGTFLDFEIGYSYTYTDKLTGKEVTNSYVAYASSYVEGIIQPAGMYIDSYRTKPAFHSGTESDWNYRILGLNTYGSFYDPGDGSGGNADSFKEDETCWSHGYFDYTNLTPYSWSQDANAAAGYGTVLFAIDNGDGGRYGNTAVDRQRPVSTTYIDSSRGTALNGSNINLRYAAMDLRYNHKTSEYDRYLTSNVRVQPGEVAWSSDTIDNTTASNQIAFASMNQNVEFVMDGGNYNAHAYRLSNYAISVPFNGTTYKDALTTLADGTKEVYYTFITELFARYTEADRLNTVHTAVDLHFVVYNKADLRGLVEDMLDYYVPVSPTGTEMGIMPQARYYSSGWNEFKTALTNAQRVLAKPNLAQADIDAAYTQLTNAKAGLVVAKADYKVIDQAVQTLSGLVPDHYTTESWQKVTDARAAVGENYTAFYQNAVNKMGSDLLLAIDGLEFRPADFTTCDEAIAAAGEVNREVYTDESLAALDALVTEAQSEAFRAKNIQEQDYIYSVADSIYEAINNLKYKPADYTEVDKQVTRYRAIDTTRYTAASYERVTAFYEQIVYGLNIMNQTLVDEMANDLKNAIDNYLVLKTADYSSVETAIAKYEELDSKLYTKDSWAILEDAVDSVEYDLDLDHQEEVYAMAQAIEDAIDNLQYTIGDYTAVSDEITRYENEYLPKKDLYTSASWTDYENAVNAVVYGITVDRQSEIDAYANAIALARQALQAGPADYSAVDVQVERYNKLDTSLYTTASILVARKAYNAIDRTKTSEEQALVDEMAENLKNAIDNLEVKPADYSAVTAAQTAAKVETDKQASFAAAYDGHAYYTEDSYQNLLNALNAVVEGLDKNHQAEVTQMAVNINAAINALEENEASYAKVDAAKAKIPADTSKYTDESVAKVTLAVMSVEEGLLTDEQDYVDSFATAIETAIAGLEYKPLDTTAYTNAQATKPADLSGYTDDSVKDVTDAENAIETFLLGDVNISHQSAFDSLVATYVEAIANLQVKAESYFKANENSTCKISADGYITGLQTNLTLNNLKNKYLDYSDDIVVTGPAGRFLGNGAVIKVTYPDGTVEEYTIIIYGDFNGDGNVNATDVTSFSKFFQSTGTLTPAQTKAMNINGDRFTNATDLNKLQNIVAKGLVIDQVTPKNTK